MVLEAELTKNVLKGPHSSHFTYVESQMQGKKVHSHKEGLGIKIIR